MRYLADVNFIIMVLWYIKMICENCGKEHDGSYGSGRFYNKQCSKENRKLYRKQWHQINKVRRLRLIYAVRKKRILIFEEYKKTLKCKICGASHPAILDFHHKEEYKKEFDISRQIKYKDFEQLKDEINKCEVLCANCHRILHYNLRKGLLV